MIAPGILESTVKVSAISDSPQVENREENIAKHEQEAFDNDRNDKGQQNALSNLGHKVPPADE